MTQKLLSSGWRHPHRPVVICSLIAVLGFLVCFNFYFSFGVADTSNSIDGSWQYTLSGLRHAPQSLGVDIFFNYGPLFERSIVFTNASDTLHDFVTSNLLIGFIFLLCCISIVLFVKHWVPRGKKGIAYVLFGVTYVILTINQIDTLFFLVALTGLLAIRRENRLWVQLLLLLGLQLFSLFKFDLTLYLLALTPVALFTSFKKVELYRTLRRFLLFICTYYTAYLALTGDLSLGFFRYIRYGLTNALYYNEFMSLPFAQNKNLLLLVIAVVAIVTAVFTAVMIRALMIKKPEKKWDAIASMLLALATMLILFKHAAVRNDGHLLALSPILLVPFLALVACIHSKAIVGKRIAGQFTRSSSLSIAAAAVAWCMALSFHWFAVNYFTNTSPLTIAEAQLKQIEPSITANRLNYGLFKERVALASTTIHKRDNEVAIINAQLSQLHGSKDLLFYGNTTLFGSLLDRHYNVRYAPFLQNYSAHPPTLFDPLYVSFLRDHPHALLFVEENEPSIDLRIPAHELNDTFQYIRANYKIVAQDPLRRQFVLQRIASKQEACTSYTTVAGNKTDLTMIPSASLAPNQYLKMKVIFPINPAEKLIGAAIKSPVYSIHLHSVEGGIMTMHTTETTLKHGVAVDPLYLSVYDALADTPFVLKGFALQGGLDKMGGYQASFEICSFR